MRRDDCHLAHGPVVVNLGKDDVCAVRIDVDKAKLVTHADSSNS
jgi:hypothetical protein